MRRRTTFVNARHPEGRRVSLHDRVCFVVGRAAFEEGASGVSPFLRYGGGEAIRGGPGEVAELAAIGTPSGVVAQLDLTRLHDDPYVWPSLHKLFVGALLGLRGRYGELHHRSATPATDVLAIWQPDHPDYGRYTRLPR